MFLLLTDAKIFLQMLEEHNLKYVFVPAGCTRQLQPLDVAVNEPFKCHLKERLDSGLSVENVKIDLSMSIIKPIHCEGLMKNMEWLSEQKVLLRGWKDIGLLDKLSGTL